MDPQPETDTLVQRNIDRVIRLEERASRNENLFDWISDVAANSVGTVAFVGVHVFILLTWLVINTGLLPWIAPFDAYPFNLLGTVASAEAVVLAAVVVIKQNRMAGIADKRDHLDLQVNLMAEQEASMIIQMLDRISRRLDIPADASEDALKLSRTQTLDHLVEQLHARYPDTRDLPAP